MRSLRESGINIGKVKEHKLTAATTVLLPIILIGLSLRSPANQQTQTPEKPNSTPAPQLIQPEESLKTTPDGYCLSNGEPHPTPVQHAEQALKDIKDPRGKSFREVMKSLGSEVSYFVDVGLKKGTVGKGGLLRKNYPAEGSVPGFKLGKEIGAGNKDRNFYIYAGEKITWEAEAVVRTGDVFDGFGFLVDEEKPVFVRLWRMNKKSGDHEQFVSPDQPFVELTKLPSKKNGC